MSGGCAVGRREEVTQHPFSCQHQNKAGGIRGHLRENVGGWRMIRRLVGAQENLGLGGALANGAHHPRVNL
ncbi:MAG: hypothetical protein QW688_04380 [Thermoprotei archaeon]